MGRTIRILGFIVGMGCIGFAIYSLSFPATGNTNLFVAFFLIGCSIIAIVIHNNPLLPG